MLDVPGNSDCELIFCLEDWGLIGFGLFFAIVVGIPFLIWGWSKLMDNANSKIKCPHCGANWWSRSVRGGGLGNAYWAEYFCYNCQRYWT